MLSAIDFDVIILLSSIMIINHIVVHLKETRNAIAFLQEQVQASPVRGFWVISLAAFVVSPFLTNDGVCLLFVEPILNAFEHLHPGNGENMEAGVDSGALVVAGGHSAVEQQSERAEEDTTCSTGKEGGVARVATAQSAEGATGEQPLRREDALFFLLALACSSNLGSALTYTGNPQNMIVASDSNGVLPPYKFLIYMLPPTLFGWLISKLCFAMGCSLGPVCWSCRYC